MVMETAIGDEEHVAARDLAVDHAAHVDAGGADEIAPELDDSLAAAAPLAFGDELPEVGADRCQIERLLAGK
jgi:hypothetical protein